MTKNQKKNSPLAYHDVRTVMDLALQKPGLIYRLSTVGAAINFRQRCNRFRVMLREQEAERMFGIPGARPEIAYDQLTIRQTDAEGTTTNKGTYIRFEQDRVVGELIDPETGETITLPNAPFSIEE